MNPSVDNWRCIAHLFCNTSQISMEAAILIFSQLCNLSLFSLQDDTVLKTNRKDNINTSYSIFTAVLIM